MHFTVGKYFLIIMLSLLSLKVSAMTLVDQLHQSYADVSYFEAKFIQEKTVKYLSNKLISKGNIKFSKSQGMIWEVTEPIWVKTKIDETGIYKTNQFYQHKKVTDVQMKAVAGILTELLSSQLDQIESQFEISDVTLDEQQNSWHVSLLAQSAIIKKALKSLQIQGNLASDSQAKGISRITIVDQSENATVIEFSDVKLISAPLAQDLLDDFQ